MKEVFVSASTFLSNEDGAFCLKEVEMTGSLISAKVYQLGTDAVLNAYLSTAHLSKITLQDEARW